MDYLFFDIECADGHNICSFGYVLTDADFNVSEKKDLLVNPHCPFRLGRSGFDPGIKLAYDKKEFYASPDFAQRYAEIAALFGAKDRMFFGHSVASDVTYLVDACMRYNKKRLRYDACDTQMMYAKLDPEHKIRSLDGIMTEIGADVSGLVEHKSCDDAEMTMLTAKHVCAALGCGLSELAKRFPDCVVNYKSIELMHAKSAVKKTIKSCNKSRKNAAELKKIYISDTVVAKDVELRRELVRIAYRRKYAFTVDVAEADIVVSGGALTAIESEYLKNAPTVQRITIEQLAALLRAKINGKGEAIVSLKRYFALHNPAPSAVKQKNRKRNQ